MTMLVLSSLTPPNRPPPKPESSNRSRTRCLPPKPKSGKWSSSPGGVGVGVGVGVGASVKRKKKSKKKKKNKNSLSPSSLSLLSLSSLSSSSSSFSFSSPYSSLESGGGDGGGGERERPLEGKSSNGRRKLNGGGRKGKTALSLTPLSTSREKAGALAVVSPSSLSSLSSLSSPVGKPSLLPLPSLESSSQPQQQQQQQQPKKLLQSPTPYAPHHVPRCISWSSSDGDEDDKSKKKKKNPKADSSNTCGDVAAGRPSPAGATGERGGKGRAPSPSPSPSPSWIDDVSLLSNCDGLSECDGDGNDGGSSQSSPFEHLVADGPFAQWVEGGEGGGGGECEVVGGDAGAGVAVDANVGANVDADVGIDADAESVPSLRSEPEDKGASVPGDNGGSRPKTSPDKPLRGRALHDEAHRRLEKNDLSVALELFRRILEERRLDHSRRAGAGAETITPSSFSSSSLSFKQTALEPVSGSHSPTTLFTSSPCLGAALHNVGLVLSRMGRCLDALVALDESLSIRIFSQGRHHLDVALTQIQRGTAMLHLGRHCEAAGAFRDALRILRMRSRRGGGEEGGGGGGCGCGDDDHDNDEYSELNGDGGIDNGGGSGGCTRGGHGVEGGEAGVDIESSFFRKIYEAEVLSRLGCLYFEAGELIASGISFEDAIDVYRFLLKKSLKDGKDGGGAGGPGGKHPALEGSKRDSVKRAFADALCNLGSVQSKKKEFGEAIKCFKEALEIQRNLKEDGDASSAIATMDNLAFAYAKSKEYGRAIHVYHSMLQAQLSYHGHYHDEYARTLGKMCLLEERRKDHAAALECAREILALKERRHSGDPKDHPSILLARGTVERLEEQVRRGG